MKLVKLLQLMKNFLMKNFSMIIYLVMYDKCLRGLMSSQEDHLMMFLLLLDDVLCPNMFSLLGPGVYEHLEVQ